MAFDGVASVSFTQCEIIRSRAASAYVPAEKQQCQNPCIDIGDGAGMTTALVDHPFQKLSSNIGKLSTFGLFHIAVSLTPASIHDHCCRGA